jgi:predicted ATPase
MLAYYPRRPHSRETLIDTLWPDADLTAARNRLSQALVWLRPQLEPKGVPRGSMLIAERMTIRLNPDTLHTDVADFEAALDTAARAQDPAAKRAALTRAAALYRGELLPGYYTDWILTERQRLLSLYTLALRQLAALHEAEGELEQALGEARRAVAADPMLEEAHCDAIRLLAAMGQSAAALRQYQEMKFLLSKELGIEPSPAARALVDRIRESVPTAPMPKPFAAHVAALPAPFTRLFGREAEIEQVRGMIVEDRARLITLIGPGGSGKTRLSLAVGEALKEAYDGAVAFVPLADLDDDQMIVTGIATALGLSGRAAETPMDQVVDVLSSRRFLLILDNLEHLIQGAGALTRDLLTRAPSLTVLATSRQRLGVDGEREIAVAPLRLPAESTSEELLSSPSVQLFVDRAQAVRPDFAVTPVNAVVIAQLCQKLEGIPLAIELCAAWAQTLTPSQMLLKLEHRFDLLVNPRSDAPARHRTLHAALDYSYSQLPEDLRWFFTALSVFQGAWSLEAAEAILSRAGRADALEAVTKLRERSLIWAEDAGAEMRFRMLDSLREFAAQRLAASERAELRRAHAAYFRELAEQADAGLAGADQDRWLMTLDRERDNLRAALAWALDTGEAEEGLSLGGTLERYWSIRGVLQEGARWMERLFALPTDSVSPRVLARAWTACGHLSWAQGDYPAARSAHEQALALSRASNDAAGVAESLYHLAITSYREDDYATARTLLDESLVIAREERDLAGIARVLLNLGNIAYEEQRFDDAREYVTQSLEIEKRRGNRRRYADSLSNLGLIARDTQQYDLADRLLRESLEIRRDLTDNYGASITIANLASLALMRGQLDRAEALLIDGLKLAYEVGNKHILGYYLRQFGLLEADRGKPDRAVTLFAAAQHLFEQIGSSFNVIDNIPYEKALASARAALSGVAFEAAWFHGETDSLGQIVSWTLTREAS